MKKLAMIMLLLAATLGFAQHWVPNGDQANTFGAIQTAPGWAVPLCPAGTVVDASGAGCISLSGYAPLASPTFTGMPVVPGYETSAAAALLAPLASPVFTGSPVVPGYAPLASPTFTGMPVVPGYQPASTNLTTYAGIAPTANAQSILGMTYSQMLTALGIPSPFELVGTINASSNPNYPACSLPGQTWVVTVGGLIGGGSGSAVAQNDTILCITANAGGTQASVGADFAITDSSVAVTALLANYAPLASPTFTGSPVVPGYLTTAAAASTYETQTAAASQTTTGNSGGVTGVTVARASMKFNWIGTFPTSQIFAQILPDSSEVYSVPSSCTNSRAESTIAATASTTLTLYKCTAAGFATCSSVGTIVFAAAGKTGTWTCSSAFTLTGSSSQSFYIQAPSTADTTLANVSVALYATHN